MAEIPVTKQGLVSIRGVFVPVNDIRAAMIETGGIVVSDPEINRLLDKAKVKKRGDVLVIDAYPDNYFIPVWLKIHNAPLLDGIWLYFAVGRKKYV